MSVASTARRLTVLFAATCLSSMANATAQRTFVASHGVDNPSCSISAPCRGFVAAVAATSANGEVIVLDSAGYGAVTITKSVSVIAPPGVYAAISVGSGNGITVSAGPSDKVVLRGLAVNGQGGLDGIHVTSGGTTYIEDCTVSDLAQNGISIVGGDFVHIARTVVRGNQSSGVFVGPAAAVAITATVVDSTLTGNGAGGFFALTQIVGSTISAAVTRSFALGNGTGFGAHRNGQGTITLTVADSTAARNATVGVFASGPGATAIISGSSFSQNASLDIAQDAGAVVRTSNNNTVTGRTFGDVFGTLTPNPLR